MKSGFKLDQDYKAWFTGVKSRIRATQLKAAVSA